MRFSADNDLVTRSRSKARWEDLSTVLLYPVAEGFRAPDDDVCV